MYAHHLSKIYICCYLDEVTGFSVCIWKVCFFRLLNSLAMFSFHRMPRLLRYGMWYDYSSHTFFSAYMHNQQCVFVCVHTIMYTRLNVTLASVRELLLCYNTLFVAIRCDRAGSFFPSKRN